MPNITLNLTNLTSSPASPISATAGDSLTITLSANAGYYLPTSVTFGSEIVTKTYTQSTGIITLIVPAVDTTIVAVGNPNIEKVLVDKTTFENQQTAIKNAILNTPSSIPARYCEYVETVSNEIVIHNHGGTTPTQRLTLEGLPAVPTGGDKFLHADTSSNLEWVDGTGGGGTTVVANPTLAGTEALLKGLTVGSTSYKIEDYEIVEITETEYTAGSISSTKYTQLTKSKAIKGVYINSAYYPVICSLVLVSGTSYIFVGHFNIDDAFFKVSVKVSGTYALTVVYQSGKLNDLERTEVEAVLDTSLLPDTYQWEAALTESIFNKMKTGKVVLNIKLVQTAGGTADYIGTLSDYYFINGWNGFGGNLIINKGVATSSQTNITITVTKDASSNVTLTAKSEPMFATRNDIKPAATGNGYGICNSVSATLGKDVTITDYNLTTNGRVSILFTNAVLANTTLNINSEGAKAIFYKGSAIVDGIIKANDIATFVYDGTNYIYVGKDADNGSTPESLGFGYATCSTAEATVAKDATLTNYVLTKNGSVSVKFDNAVPANATLNVNTAGAKAIYYHGAAITAGVISAGSIGTFIYDGTNYNLIAIDAGGSSTPTPESLGFGYGLCSTAEATTAKTATLSNYVLTTNGYVSIKFTNKVPASSTLSINSETAKPIYYKGAAITAGKINAGDIAVFVYDGTNYNLIGKDVMTASDVGLSEVINAKQLPNILSNYEEISIGSMGTTLAVGNIILVIYQNTDNGWFNAGFAYIVYVNSNGFKLSMMWGINNGTQDVMLDSISYHMTEGTITGGFLDDEAVYTFTSNDEVKFYIPKSST